MNESIIPTKIFEGKTLECIKKLVKKNQKVLIVTGKHVEKSVESVEELKEFFGENVLVFNDIKQNPVVANIEELTKTVLLEKIEFIIGIGGGSILDTAKAASVLAANKGYILTEFLSGKKAKNPPILFVAIPTTAGTGSEVTPFAAIYEEINGKKRKRSFGFFREKNFFPYAAVLDPENVKTMPKNVIASSGFDALCQCIESLWSNNSTDFSEQNAVEGIKLFLKNFEKFYEKPDGKDSALNMLRAANKSGIAISQSMTTSCHSISYALTMLYGIFHGHAVALSMSEMIKYNYDITIADCLHPKGPEHVKKKIMDICRLFEAKTIEEFSKKFLELMEKTGLKTKLSEFGILEKDLELILESAFTSERMNNNPRKVSVKDCRQIIGKMF